jgi:hypothetical protein
MLTLICFCCCSVFAWTQAAPNNWDKLNLSSINIAGTNVYYEKCFEPNLPFFETAYKNYWENGIILILLSLIKNRYWLILIISWEMSISKNSESTAAILASIILAHDPNQAGPIKIKFNIE